MVNQLAQLLALTANAHFKAPYGKKGWNADDFLPKPPEPKKTEEQKDDERDYAQKWVDTLAEMRANRQARPN